MDQSTRKKYAAFLGALIIIISGCAASRANPESPPQDSQPTTKMSTPPENVVDLLTRLKYAIDSGLIDNPNDMENLMGFKFYNSIISKIENDKFMAAFKSKNGSWGGLVATWERKEITTTIGFMPVHGRGSIEETSPSIIKNIFGEPSKIIKSQDFHRIGGDQYIYESIGNIRTTIYCTFSSASNGKISLLDVTHTRPIDGNK